jgi:hypothetical protein
MITHLITEVALIFGGILFFMLIVGLLGHWEDESLISDEGAEILSKCKSLKDIEKHFRK